MQMSRYQIAMSLLGDLIDKTYHIFNVYCSICLSGQIIGVGGPSVFVLLSLVIKETALA